MSVNGQPAKGTYASQAVSICVPTPVPGQELADTTYNSMRYETDEILQTDGTSVGTIMTEGLNAGDHLRPGHPRDRKISRLWVAPARSLAREDKPATRLRG